jgi:hypothetical protein
MSNAGTTLQRRQGPEAQTHEIGRPIHTPLIKEGHQMIYTSPEGILLMRQENRVDGGRVGVSRKYIRPFGIIITFTTQRPPNDLSPETDQRPPNDLSPETDQRPPNDLSPETDQRPPNDLSPETDQRPPKTPVIEAGRGRATSAYLLLRFGG